MVEVVEETIIGKVSAVDRTGLKRIEGMLLVLVNRVTSCTKTFLIFPVSANEARATGGDVQISLPSVGSTPLKLWVPAR